jgi:hypothetical protein
LFDGGRKWPVFDGGKLLWVHLDALGRNNEAEEFNLSLVKFAFLSIGKEVGTTKTFKDLTDEFVMVLTRVGIDKNVIQINNAGDIQKIMEGVLNKSLECRRGIGETKGHDGVLEETKMGMKSCLPFITLLDPDEVECILQVDDCEMRTACNTINKGIGKRKWIAIFFGDGVETLIVDAEMEETSLASGE